jgi:hypothetical protein
MRTATRQLDWTKAQVNICWGGTTVVDMTKRFVSKRCNELSILQEILSTKVNKLCLFRSHVQDVSLSCDLLNLYNLFMYLIVWKFHGSLYTLGKSVCLTKVFFIWFPRTSRRLCKRSTKLSRILVRFFFGRMAWSQGGWAGHVARMEENRNAYRILVGKPEGKDH